jgi:hypothetical protein
MKKTNLRFYRLWYEDIGNRPTARAAPVANNNSFSEGSASICLLATTDISINLQRFLVGELNPGFSSTAVKSRQHRPLACKLSPTYLDAFIGGARSLIDWYQRRGSRRLIERL